MQITIEKLIEINACNEARAWFRDAFPSGSTPISPEVLAKCDRDDWLCWLACKLSESYRLWCAGVAFREAAKVNPVLAKWSMNITIDNWREAKSAAAADAYAAAAASAAYDAAYAAAAAAAYAAYAAAAAAYAAAAAAADAAADATYDAAYDAAAAAYAAAYAVYAAAAAAYAAAKKLVYHEMRIEAERVLCAL